MSQKLDRIDNKLKFILRNHRHHYSTAESPQMSSIDPTASLNTNRSASQQLINLEIDYAILKDLRKKSAEEREIGVLDSMIQEFELLKYRLEYLAQRAGNMDFQERRLKLLDPHLMDSVLTFPEEDRANGETLQEEFESSGSMVSFTKPDCDNLASTAAVTADSAEWLSPVERVCKVIQPEEIRLEEIEDVEM
jgi:hypothetical protein